MGRVATTVRAGETLHVWLRGTGSAPAAVTFSVVGAADGVLGDAMRPEFVMRVAIAAREGAASLAWDDATTELSLAYAFHPATVADEGIHVLWTTPRNRIPEPAALFHFQPPWGWMNDPNGLFTRDGVVHLFYQHYPHALRWNTMHWGHATSQDGVTWVHQPIFLLPREELLGDPDKRGGAFSGSSLPLPDGTLRVFYTDREDDRLPDWEWQMTALSVGATLVGPSLPVVATRPPVPGLRKDFRDPYVFTGPDGRLKMLLGSGDEAAAIVLLYETDAPDGADGWRFVDILFRTTRYGALPAECPCMVALEGEGVGLWALFVGFVGSRDRPSGRRNLNDALVGRFDGRRFTPLVERTLDFGTDCYAFQAFPTAAGPCGIAWAANWTDVHKDQDFMSRMTMPRRIVWHDGQLLTPPAPAVERLRQAPLEPPPSRAEVALPAGAAEYAVRFTRPGAAFKLHLGHPTRCIAVIGAPDAIEIVDTPCDGRTTPRYREDGVAIQEFRLFLDRGVLEFYADGGRWCGTRRIEGCVTSLLLLIAPEAIAEETLWPLSR